MALVVPGAAGVSLDRPYRPVRIVFRLLATGALRADAGTGARALAARRRAMPPAVLRRCRAAGLRLAPRLPPSRPGGSRQDDPVACTILSVTSEIMGNT